MRPAATVLGGFRHPVHDSQRVFRGVLDAMAHPGRIVGLDAAVATAAPLHRGTMALLLALTDLETPLWLSPSAGNDAVLGAIRFHCGSPIVADPSRAAFAVAASAAERPRLDALDLGSDLYPERAATLILQVDGLGVGREIVLAGPGIDGTARLAVDGLDEAFWAERNALEILFPRGLDVILVDGEAVATVPRSTAVEA